MLPAPNSVGNACRPSTRSSSSTSRSIGRSSGHGYMFSGHTTISAPPACARADGSRRRASLSCFAASPSHSSGMFGCTTPKRIVRVVSPSRLAIRHAPSPKQSPGIATAAAAQRQRLAPPRATASTTHTLHPITSSSTSATPPSSAAWIHSGCAASPSVTVNGNNAGHDHHSPTKLIAASSGHARVRGSATITAAHTATGTALHEQYSANSSSAAHSGSAPNTWNIPMNHG
ncbi:MAG: hypothetical protein IPO88_13325 [Nannocystis sp.]|nr:hypothetical protein [Nannocystis sp.]